jgi:uncharacterized OB-fold protein
MSNATTGAAGPAGTAKTRVPAVEGWFTMDPDEPRLLGSRCTTCGTYVFPKADVFCRNPECDGTEFDVVPLSRRGRVWSYTTNCYQPPPPYIGSDPFTPFAIAAVELPDEKMVVLGQVATAGAGGPDDGVEVGADVELVLDTLYEDEEHEYVVWKWRPTEVSR